MERKKRLIVGLTGPIAGGKGVVACYLKQKGFFYSSTSDRVREEIVRRGGEVTRENLQRVADELRRKYGPAVLAKRTWEMVINQPNPKVVIDSIRGEAEVDFLKKKKNFWLIGVTAARRIRFERIKKRGRECDPKSWEEFLKIDKKDFKSGRGKFGRDIKKCLDEADFLIVNDGGVDQLKKKVDNILKKILDGKRGQT